jgi:hypothetical protein
MLTYNTGKLIILINFILILTDNAVECYINRRAVLKWDVVVEKKERLWETLGLRLAVPEGLRRAHDLQLVLPRERGLSLKSQDMPELKKLV